MKHISNVLFYNWKNLDTALIMGGDWDAAGIGLDISGEYNSDSFAKFDFVIMAVSDDFLRSPHDMHEALIIYTDSLLQNKIIPVVTRDARIFDDIGCDSYVAYWESEANKLKKQAGERNPVINMDDIRMYADDYLRIAENIPSFIGYIIDRGCFAWPDIRKTNYSLMLEYMGYGKDDMDNIIKGLDAYKQAQAEENNPGYYMKVRRMMEESVKLNPEDNETWHNLADLLEEQFNEYDEAKKCYLKAIALHPDDIDAHYDFAIMLREHLDDYQTAAQHYEEIIKLNPRYVAAHYELALLCKDHLDDTTRGKYHYRIACELEPSLRSSVLDEVFGTV